YGAAGRANTLLNYCGISTQYLDYIVDESPSRQDRFTPGTNIPIVKPSKKDLKADYILILAWNYQEQIVEKCRKSGYKGELIIPLPKVEVV
ncbi:MAG: hypothetical protein Q8O72_11325, partial [Bacteroidales bacterium]|nr:hypothetical protein [Bacteroidales bacterium]